MISRLSTTSISVSQAVRNHYFPDDHPTHRALVIHDLGNAALVADDRDPVLTGPRPRDLPTGGRLVLMVGRIEPWKGQHVFVEAVELLTAAQRGDAIFALAGESVQGKEAYFDQIRLRAAAVGILLLGSRTDVPALLRAADISVHASVSPDPFPGVVVESLLAGAATIAAAAGGAVEMIEDDVHGRLCPPGDSKALAAALSDLLVCPQSPRSRFGANARARALMLVEAGRIDAAVMAVYDDALSEARTGPQTQPNGRAA